MLVEEARVEEEEEAEEAEEVEVELQRQIRSGSLRALQVGLVIRSVGRSGDSTIGVWSGSLQVE